MLLIGIALVTGAWMSRHADSRAGPSESTRFHSHQLDMLPARYARLRLAAAGLWLGSNEPDLPVDAQKRCAADRYRLRLGARHAQSRPVPRYCRDWH